MPDIFDQVGGESGGGGGVAVAPVPSPDIFDKVASTSTSTSTDIFDQVAEGVTFPSPASLSNPQFPGIKVPSWQQPGFDTGPYGTGPFGPGRQQAMEEAVNLYKSMAESPFPQIHAQSTLGKIAAAPVNVASGLITPLNALLAPLTANPIVGPLAKAGFLGMGLGQAGQSLYQAQQTRDPGDITTAIISQGLAPLVSGESGAKAGEVVTGGGKAPGGRILDAEQTQVAKPTTSSQSILGAPNAGVTDLATLASVIEDLKNSMEKNQIQPPVEGVESPANVVSDTKVLRPNEPVVQPPAVSPVVTPEAVAVQPEVQAPSSSPSPSAAPSPSPSPSPLRQEVESQSTLLHDMKSAVTLISDPGLTDLARKNLKAEAAEVSKAFAGGESPELLRKRVDTLREHINRTRELHEELGPQEVPEQVKTPSSDLQQYNSLLEKQKPLVRSMLDAMRRGDTETASKFEQQHLEIQKQIEEVKNRNKGFVPTEAPSGGSESEGSGQSLAQTSSSTPHTFEQGLRQVESEEQALHTELGINEGASMHDVLSKMTPENVGKESHELAQFLLDKFGHVLRGVGIEPGVGRVARANYDPIPHKAFLGVGIDKTALPTKLLEEATHAATWWLLEHPVTDVQVSAVSALTDLMERSKWFLSETEKAKIGKQEFGLAYRHKNLQEFVAGVISDPVLRNHLDSLPDGEKSMFARAYDWVRKLIGIGEDTALDKAMQELRKVGEEGRGVEEGRAKFRLDPIGEPQLAPQVALKEATTKERIGAWWKARLGITAPRHAQAGEAVANRLVEYGVAKSAAPLVARSLATDVLGKHWQDANFDRVIGALLVEDRLRGLKEMFTKLADKATDPLKEAELRNKANAVKSIVGAQGSPIRTDAEFRLALGNRENAAAIERHKQLVQPLVEDMHVRLGGQLSAPGENTGAFINLLAMFDDPTAARDFIYSSRQGNLTNPRVQASKFSKQAGGTAEVYNLSYRTLAERAVKGNYEQSALKTYYDTLIDKGLAFDSPTETKKGVQYKELEIKPSRAFISGKKIYIRPDLYEEARQALRVDTTPSLGALGLLTQAATDLQIIGVADLTFHSANMIATLATSQGAKSLWYDAIRKMGAIPVPIGRGKAVPGPVGLIDALMRVGYHSLRAFHDDPQVQKELADITKIGAGRDMSRHQGGLISKAVGTVMDIPVKDIERFDPLAYMNKVTSIVLKTIDRGGRLAANEMYSNLVSRGLTRESELGRREFINKLGQYNSAIMPRMDELLRNWGLAPFIVAGKNMNRQAISKVFMSSGVKAANPEAFYKMKAVEVMSLASLAYVMPIVFNYVNTGTPFGRPGTDVGQVDLGGEKDKVTGKHKVFDILQPLLLRRGTRITGAQALTRGMREEGTLNPNAIHQAFNDVYHGIIHPFIGPVVNDVSIAKSGYDTQGYLQSKNPTSTAENLVAALKNLNPTTAAMFKDSDTAQVGNAGKSLAAAVGVKESRNPSYKQRLDEAAGGVGAYDKLNLAQRAKVSKQVKQEQPQSNELARRNAAITSEWNAFSRQDALKDSLPVEQRQWLDARHLRLPGFESELQVGKVRVLSSPEEQKSLAKLVSEEYSKMIERQMQLDRKPSQDRLDELLSLARKRARAGLRREMNAHSGQP